MFIKIEACSIYVATVYITNFVNIHHSLLSMTQCEYLYHQIENKWAIFCKNDFTWLLRTEITRIMLSSILDQNIANYYPGRYILSHLCKTLTLKNNNNSIFPRCRQKSCMFCVPCNVFDNFRLNWRLPYSELCLDISLENRTHFFLVCGQETNILLNKEIWLFNWKYILFLHKIW